MTETRAFANPLTAAGREKMRENMWVGREVVNRYPGAGTSNRITMMFGFVVFVGFRQEDFWAQLLFGFVIIITLMPFEMALSALLAEVAHVRFGVARTATLLVATIVAAVGIGLLRDIPVLDPNAARTAIVAVFGLFVWTATLLCASYLRKGRATPAPEAGAFENLARGQMSFAMAGATAAGFTLVVVLLAVWIWL